MFQVDTSYPLAIKLRMSSAGGTSVEEAADMFSIAIHRFAMPLTSFQRVMILCVDEHDPEYKAGIIQLSAHLLTVTQPEFRGMGHVADYMMSHLKDHGIISPVVTLDHLTERCDVEVLSVIALRIKPRKGRISEEWKNLIIEDFNAAQIRLLDTLQGVFGQPIDRDRVEITYDTVMHEMRIRCPYDNIPSGDLKVKINKVIKRTNSDLASTTLRLVGLGHTIYSPGEIAKRKVLAALKAGVA